MGHNKLNIDNVNQGKRDHPAPSFGPPQSNRCAPRLDQLKYNETHIENKTDESKLDCNAEECVMDGVRNSRTPVFVFRTWIYGTPDEKSRVKIFQPSLPKLRKSHSN